MGYIGFRLRGRTQKTNRMYVMWDDFMYGIDCTFKHELIFCVFHFK